MNSERIRALLAELDKELKSTGEIDDETRGLLSKLNDDLDEIAPGSEDTLSDSARELLSLIHISEPTRRH